MANRRTMRKPPTVTAAPRSGFAIGPHYVAAVDSAKHEPAWCLGRAGSIQAVGFDANPGTWPDSVSCVWPAIVVLEASRSYGGKDAGKHGDILAEAIGGALCAGSMRGTNVVLVAPDEWAGQTSKPARHWAIWQVLPPFERTLIATASGFESAEKLAQHIEHACKLLAYGQKVRYTHKVHNLLDAVGLYLFAVGRIKRGGGTR